MKRTTIILSLIFALAIALSASIPTLAAGSDTATTSISGTLGAHIEITAAPTSITLPELVPDEAKESATQTVSVKCNKAGWTLSVSEVAGDGYMSATVPLSNPLTVRGGDLGATYTSIVGSPQLESSGAKTGGTGISITDIQFAQTATYGDDPGTYTITVTFTATAN